MSSNWLAETLGKIKLSRIAILGEFCLDAYWFVSNSGDELSVETGLPIHRVREQRYSLGGAGNVAANLRALGVGRITAIGVIGTDPFGAVLFDLVSDVTVDTDGIVRDQANWQTCVYAKPIVAGFEQNRLDFGSFNDPSDRTIRQLVESIDDLPTTHDLLIVNQQIPNGLFRQPLIDAINRLAAKNPDFKIVVDSRHYASEFRNVSLKVNLSEAIRVISKHSGDFEQADIGVAKVAQIAYERMDRPVFITCGDRGIVVASESGVSEIHGIDVSPPIDIVGAGDTALASIAAILAVDRSPDAPAKAAKIANIAATVSLKKLHITGTASPEEILAIGPEPDYINFPDLAVDERRAVYIPGTEIEQIRPLPSGMKISHAIFDHDGTLSTLREGWEKIMQPMMVKAILGSKYATADQETLEQVTNACREFIDRTTGIQTLVQMQGLIELVRQFGFVEEHLILDNHGYKKVYNDELLNMVRKRVEKLERGELSPDDFQMKNAHALLLALYNKGVKLYLASGTDVQDVLEEARAMGYADLFEERIYGAVGDVTVEAKKLVLERIMKEIGVSGPEIVTFGDGPVEIRETRKKGGIAVGIASDEVRRFGLNPGKRKRLIRSGADLIVPDFSQLNQLLQALRLD